MRFFLLGLIIIVLSSCLSEPDCLVSASNSIKFVFKNADTEAPKFVVYPIIKLSGTDTTFVADSVTSLFLFVDPRATQTTFKFQRKNGSVDSLTLRYNIKNILISPDCGAYPYYSGLQVVAYSFFDTVRINPDTVRITNPNLSNDSTAQNVEIKF